MKILFLCLCLVIISCDFGNSDMEIRLQGNYPTRLDVNGHTMFAGDIIKIDYVTTLILKGRCFNAILHIETPRNVYREHLNGTIDTSIGGL